MILTTIAPTNSTAETASATSTSSMSQAPGTSLPEFQHSSNATLILQPHPRQRMTHERAQEFKVMVSESGSSKADSRWKEFVELLLEVGGRQ
jgi:hypothetical protein